MKPTLSILIPTRNRARYLKYAVQSALNINSSEIEILVSENQCADDSREILNSFSDKRLKIYNQDSPLAMHENWEFLLSKATGEWIYFLGDDDAMMPHAVEHLNRVVSRYPRVEAIVSPRAYYFWGDTSVDYSGIRVSCGFAKKEVWRDSKKMLAKCINGSVSYLYLPQVYSGGFQRRTLVNRIKQAQGGIYFKSVTPDAYSALVGVLHTFRYLEIGVPLAWVGTSDPVNTIFNNGLKKESVKNKDQDFRGLHFIDKLTYNFSLGRFDHITFNLCFFEACTAAVPHISYDLISLKSLKKIFYNFCCEKSQNKNYQAIEQLAEDLGFRVPNKFNFEYRFYCLRRVISTTMDRASRVAPKVFSKFGFFESNFHTAFDNQEYDDILSFNSLLAGMYSKYVDRFE